MPVDVSYIETGLFARSGVEILRLITPARDLPSQFGGYREYGHAPTADLSAWARVLDTNIVRDTATIIVGEESHIRVRNGMLEFIMLPADDAEPGWTAP